MSCTSQPQLDRIDLSTNSRDTLAALIELLAPHVPYSLNILGTILNTTPRTNTLQDVDPSKVSLWSTVPLHPDIISTTDPPALFSIVLFSHVNHQFRFFCSAESTESTDLPTQVEEAHVRHIFRFLRDLASKESPTYDSVVTAHGPMELAHRIDTDPPMIIIGAVHAKWARILAPVSTRQYRNVRYVFPRGSLSRTCHARSTMALITEEGPETAVSEIRASDLPFVRGASSVPRSDAYLLSRSSVCLRLRSLGDINTEEDAGRPVACALLHADGSIGGLRVDQEYQGRGLGKFVIRALAEKLDFSVKGQADLIPKSYQDLGGGALGWNWTDTESLNEVGNRFFASMAGEESKWSCHWTYIPVGDTGLRPNFNWL